MTKLLHTYMTFAIDSPDFSLVSLKKIVICKNNSMYVSLNPSFDTPIFSSRSGRSDELLQPANIEEDELASSIRKQEEIEVKAFDADLEVEEEDKEIQSNLRLQHIRKIIKIQASYRAQYKESHDYQSLQTPTLTPDDESALGKVYTKNGPIGRILMVRQNIQRERKCFNAFLIAMHRYDKILDRELVILVEKKEYHWFTKEALRK